MIRIRLIGLVAWFLAAGACQQKAELPRYVYVVTCDARLDRLDTVAGRKIASVDLSQASGGAMASAANGFDGCLASGAHVEAGGAKFTVIAAAQAMNKPDGTKDYRRLEFSLPDIKLTGNEAAAGEAHAVKAPDVAAGLQLIEWSGNTALVRVFAADPSMLELGVEDLATKRSAMLAGLPPTTALNAHLAPGGLAALIEVMNGSAKTGELRVVDTSTGRGVKTVNDARVRDQYFLAISPNGRAIYHSADSYAFIDLQRTFGIAPVMRALDTAPGPSVFFANQ